MKKKTWNIIIRHVVLAFLAFIWLVPIVWLFVTSLSTVKGVSGKFLPEALDACKLQPVVLPYGYGSKLPGMV